MCNGYLNQWANAKTQCIQCEAYRVMLEHDRKLNSVEEIGIRTPLVIELFDNSKFLDKINSNL